MALCKGKKSKRIKSGKLGVKPCWGNLTQWQKNGRIPPCWKMTSNKTFPLRCSSRNWKKRHWQLCFNVEVDCRTSLQRKGGGLRPVYSWRRKVNITYLYRNKLGLHKHPAKLYLKLTQLPVLYTTNQVINTEIWKIAGHKWEWKICI